MLDVSSAYYFACLRFRALILRALLLWAGLDCAVVATCGDKLLAACGLSELVVCVFL
ncbi:unnamed protein product [Laminaria digitata]